MELFIFLINKFNIFIYQIEKLSHCLFSLFPPYCFDEVIVILGGFAGLFLLTLLFFKLKWESEIRRSRPIKNKYNIIPEIYKVKDIPNSIKDCIIKIIGIIVKIVGVIWKKPECIFYFYCTYLVILGTFCWFYTITSIINGLNIANLKSICSLVDNMNFFSNYTNMEGLNFHFFIKDYALTGDFSSHIYLKGEELNSLVYCYTSGDSVDIGEDSLSDASTISTGSRGQGEEEITMHKDKDGKIFDLTEKKCDRDGYTKYRIRFESHPDKPDSLRWVATETYDKKSRLVRAKSIINAYNGHWNEKRQIFIWDKYKKVDSRLLYITRK